MKKDYIIYAIYATREKGIYILGKEDNIEDSLDNLLGESELLLDSMLDIIKRYITNHNFNITTYEEYSRNYKVNEFLN